MGAFWNRLFFTPLLYLLTAAASLLLLFAYLAPPLLPAGQGLALALLLLTVTDGLLLFQRQDLIGLRRELPERFSNGDENPVEVQIENRYRFPVQGLLIDELPEQFQVRDMRIPLRLEAGGTQRLHYTLRPVERGAYEFGALHLLVSSPLRLVRRRYTLDAGTSVPVYPGFIQMQKYQLMAAAGRLNEVGIRTTRRLGHSSEFEQIKSYVRGDDYRTINWKASARRGELMANQYTDEKAQNVYCLIDKSRYMRSAFNGLTLLDYAINASLVLANIAVQKQDKAGLITFAERIGTHVPPSARPVQISRIMETLYNQQTRFLESDYERLYVEIKRSINHRSLLILFTNFESISGMQRQLPYLKQIALNHLLVVVFFENTELNRLTEQTPRTVEEVYIKTTGQYFAYEKRQIVKELEQQGIHALLTAPEHLTVNALNTYLQLKTQRRI